MSKQFKKLLGTCVMLMIDLWLWVFLQSFCVCKTFVYKEPHSLSYYLYYIWWLCANHSWHILLKIFEQTIQPTGVSLEPPWSFGVFHARFKAWSVVHNRIILFQELISTFLIYSLRILNKFGRIQNKPLPLTLTLCTAENPNQIQHPKIRPRW